MLSAPVERLYVFGPGVTIPQPRGGVHETENPKLAQRTAESGRPTSSEDLASALAFSRSPRGSERRRYTRQDVLNQQLVYVDLGDRNGGLLLDLSSGGAAVQAVAPLRPTAASPFVFHLPQLNSQIEGTGVFVWVDGSGLSGGLRFDRLSPQSQRLLEQWLKGSRAESAPAQAEATIPEVTVPLAPAPFTPLAVSEPAFAAKLKRVAERARILSLAQGASIALRDKQGTFLCEASVGTALEVGTPLNLERGLAAECVATKGIVLCNDAQKDPRVDAAMRQQLSLGSTALLPLFARNKAIAVLTVFSNQPHAFGEQAVRRLREFARTLEAGVLRERSWRKRR
jgi:hypothetical protein